jgi:quercetin dioxygenase-like cupin family protein
MRSLPREDTMLRIVLFAIIGTLVATVSAANPIADAPKEHKGFKTLKTKVVDLGAEIDGMAGRQLRLRVLSIAPGGHIGVHSHQDRPSVVYALQGIDTITVGDGSKKILKPGDTTSATKDTTHWHKNEGNEEVLLLAVDVFNAEKAKK